MKLNKILVLLLIICVFILFSCFCNYSEAKNNKEYIEDNMEGFDSKNNALGSSSDYYPNEGIKKEDIPLGDEDLYIKKSEIVPPVCPVCPSADTCPRQKPCPACPACARCPEPSYECKLVPTPSNNPNAFPKPILNDFSTFGM